MISSLWALGQRHDMVSVPPLIEGVTLGASLDDRAFATLKEFHAVATRFDKTDIRFAASIHLAAAIIASR